MEEITPLQRTLDISTNRIVSACAGAGKTFALSKRYCAILDEFTKHNLSKPKNEWLGFKNILVITFTNKAAAEMSRRIYDDLHILLKGKEIPELKEQGITLGNNIRTAPEEYKNWLRATFSQNCIMTIDSFCGTILRENAHVLGIDPLFKTSDELLANMIYGETLGEFLAAESNAFDDTLKRILNYTDKNGIIEFFQYFEKNKVFLEDWIEYMEHHSAQEIQDRWMVKYLHEFDIETVLSELEKLASLSHLVKQGEANTFNVLRECIERLPRESEDEIRRHIMTQILPILMTASKESYYSDRSYHYIQKKSTFIHNDAYKKFKQTVSDVISVIAEHISPEHVMRAPSDDDIRSIGTMKDFVKLYKEFEEVLWKTQLRKNYLTFNDVILKTRDILTTHNEIRRQVSNKFKHILIDEFQDTNNLRWDIIYLIAQNDDNTLRKSGLFIVGDKKQSIYRFQQADVEVMNRATAELSALSDQSYIEFNDNYRASEKYITHVINPFFNNILSSPEHAFDTSFEETIYPQHNSSSSDIADKTNILCDVHAVLQEPSESSYVPSLHAAYMTKKYLTWAEEAGVSENVVVGILLRNFTHINEYLKVFQEYAIPFQIIGGRNLFSQQEIYDLYHFVSVMINPHDDVSLIGLLRSPFFCIEDTMVYRLKERKNDESFFDLMSRNEEYASIVQSISAWRQSAHTDSLHSLLSSILLQAHRELGYVSEAAGPQRLANLDKVIHIFYSLQLDGNSLQDIHKYLIYQLEHRSDIAQGELPTSAKVNIMTIHKAKGLEFPAVILPELENTSTRKSTDIIYHSRLLPDDQIEVGITIKEGIESKKTNLLENIKKQDKLEQQAEDKRLFYVAMTRAKYRIALLADFKGNPSKSSWWYDYVANVLELPTSTNKDEWNAVQSPDKIKITLEDLDSMLHELQNDKNKSKQESEWHDPPTLEPPHEMWNITPHLIMESLFPDSPSDYKTDDCIEKRSSLAFGSIFHEVIAHHWWDLDKSKENIISFIQYNYPEISYDEIEDQLQKQISYFLTGEVYDTIRSLNNDELFHELPVVGWLDNGELFLEVHGIIDFLYKSNGDWYIIDFKTDSSTRSHHKYEIQLQTYQWMIKQLYNIEAKAYINYTALGSIHEVTWDDTYFEKIFPEQIHPFRFSSLVDSSLPGYVQHILDREKDILILNPTEYESRRMTQTLAKRELLYPGIQITTLNKLQSTHTSYGKKITPECGSLLVRKAAEAFSLKDGTVDLLFDSFHTLFLWNRKYKGNETLESIYSNFEQLRKKGNYYYDQEIIKKHLTSIMHGKTVLVNGFYKDTPVECEIVSQIVQEAQKFYFINNFDSSHIQSSFTIKPNAWEAVRHIKPGRNQEITSYFSIETEIDAIAQKIYTQVKEGRQPSSIIVAVSSMYAYLPLISRIFPSYGIPYHPIAGKSLAEQPLSRFMISFLIIMLSSERLTWNTVSSLVLHPLFDTSREIFDLDCYMRKNGITYLNNIVDMDRESSHSEAIQQIIELIERIKRIGDDLTNPTLFKELESLLTQMGVLKKITQDSSLQNVYTALQNCVRSVIDAYQNIGLELDSDNLLNDIKKSIKKKIIRSRKSEHGVEIIGFMDTLNLHNVTLYVAGLSENYFPVPTKNNPFASSIPSMSWSKSVMLLNHWQNFDSKLYYLCAARDMDGNVLNPSTLLENFTIMEKTTQKPGKPITPRQHYLRYYDRKIIDPVLPVHIRHNELLTTALGHYKGFVKPESISTYTFSARGMNTLIQCPMQYLFDEILKAKPLTYDEDAQERLDVGNVIHKALEDFGKKTGFELIKNDPARSCELLAQTLDHALKYYHIDPEMNLFVKRVYAPYVDGLSSGIENNVLVTFVTFYQKYMHEYSPLSFEKVFGMHDSHDQNTWEVFTLKGDDITLHFHGKIDGIFNRSEHHDILCIDYKTGSSPKPADIESFWDIQPLLYMMVMKSHFPDKRSTFLYESLKDIALYMEPPTFLYEKDDLLVIKQKKTTLSLQKEEIQRIFLAHGFKVKNGEFHIREREYGKKPCEYCDFKRICRKDCYPSNIKDNL